MLNTAASATNEISLDRLSHTYTRNGSKYDAVTDVISGALGSGDNPWYKPEHSLRGTFVHRITEAIDEGDWDPALMVFPSHLGWDDLAKQRIIKRGYAYQRFLADTGFEATQKETIVWSDMMLVAGMIDKLGIIRKGDYQGCRAIVDIKSGEPTPAARLQVALYDLLLWECAADPVQLRIVLWLKENGDCRPEFYAEHRDLVDARSIVNVFRFKQRHKLL